MERDTEASNDPIVAVFREHTVLQQLAARFHELAQEVEHREPERTLADIAEAVELHERLLVRVHHRRESELAQAIGSAAPPSVRSALERCRLSHPAAVSFERALRALLESGPLTAERRAEAARALHREADRIIDHHREEDETIYRPIHHALPAEVLAQLASSMRAIAGEAAAAQARVLAWTARVHGAAD